MTACKLAREILTALAIEALYWIGVLMTPTPQRVRWQVFTVDPEGRN